MAGRTAVSKRTFDSKVNPVRLDKSGTQTVAAIPGRFYNNDPEVPLELQAVNISAGTAPAGSALVVDVKINGTSVFSAAGARASIAAGANTGTAVPDKDDRETRLVRPGQYVTAEVTAVGSGTAGSDLVVELVFG